MILYHYCTMPTLRAIMAEGSIQPRAQVLYRDLAATRIAAETPPIIWLTQNPLGEGTTMAKAMRAGYRGNGVGHMARISLDADDADTLLDFTRRTNIPRSAWRYVLMTAQAINIDPSVWRVLSRPVRRGEWLATEVMSAIDDSGTTWEPV